MLPAGVLEFLVIKQSRLSILLLQGVELTKLDLSRPDAPRDSLCATAIAAQQHESIGGIRPSGNMFLEPLNRLFGIAFYRWLPSPVRMAGSAVQATFSSIAELTLCSSPERERINAPTIPKANPPTCAQ